MQKNTFLHHHQCFGDDKKEIGKNSVIAAGFVVGKAYMIFAVFVFVPFKKPVGKIAVAVRMIVHCVRVGAIVGSVVMAVASIVITAMGHIKADHLAMVVVR
jgi:hypothetical protein